MPDDLTTTEFLYVRPMSAEVSTGESFGTQDIVDSDEETIVLKVTRHDGFIADVEFVGAVVAGFDAD